MAHRPLVFATPKDRKKVLMAVYKRFARIGDGSIRGGKHRVLHAATDGFHTYVLEDMTDADLHTLATRIYVINPMAKRSNPLHSYKRPPRVGTRVVFDPNPVSYVMYSGDHRRALPNRGGLGTVTTISGRSSMRGPGGGLVYVKWDDTDVSGASLNDITSASGWGGKSRWVGVRSNPKGKTMSKKRRKTTTTTVKTTVKTTKTRRANPKGKRRKNPTHRVETTKGGRRLRPSAGSVRKSAKLLAARRAALAAGVKPPTRSGDLDYRAAQWKLQMARKKAAAKRRRAASRGTSKPRRSRASKPVKPRYDSLASTLNAVADRWR